MAKRRILKKTVKNEFARVFNIAQMVFSCLDDYDPEIDNFYKTFIKDHNDLIARLSCVDRTVVKEFFKKYSSDFNSAIDNLYTILDKIASNIKD